VRYPARRRNQAIGRLLNAEGQIQRRAFHPGENLGEIRSADPNRLRKRVALDVGGLEICCELFHGCNFIYTKTSAQPRTLAIVKLRLGFAFAIHSPWH